jgi:hypothetical protein
MVHLLLVMLGLGLLGVVSATVIGEGCILAARVIRAGWPVIRAVLAMALEAAGVFLVCWLLTH